MSEHLLSCAAAALSAARNIRHDAPWLTGELRQKLDAVLAFVFVAEDVACASIRGNASAEALLRAPRDANLGPSALDAGGKRRFEAFDADGVPLAGDRWPLQRAARGEILGDVRFELRCADGASVFLQGEASPLRDETGAIHGAIGVFSDIGSWKKREREVRPEIEAGKARRDALPACGEPLLDLARFAPAILWVADGNGAAIAHNDKWLSYTGQTREQALGDGWTAAVHPDDFERVGKRWLESVATGADLDVEHRIRRASDSAWRWHLAKATLRRDDLGRPCCWYGTCVDIEDRRQAETARSESDQLFRTVFENAASGIAISRAAVDGVFLQTNDRFCEMLGYGPGELAGRSFTKLTHPDDRQKNAEKLRAMLAGEMATCTIEKRYLKRDGGFVWARVNLALLRDEDDKPSIFIGSMVDIGDLKQAEQALRASEERFRVLVETNAQVVFETDPAGELMHDSPAWRAFSGQTPDEWSLEGWADAVHPEDRDRAVAGWRAAIEAEIPYRNEIRFRNADDVWRWESVTAAPVRDDDGQIVKWVGMISDITDEKQAEEALRESEANLRFTLKGAHAGTWQWNIPTGEMIWSPETFALFEWDPELGAPRYDVWRNQIHPDDLEPTERRIGEVLEQRLPEHVANYRVILPSGGTRWIETVASLERAADGTPLRLFGINRDITERKQAELQLAESEARFRAAQDSSLDGFIIYEPVADKSGRIADFKFVYINPIAAKFCHRVPAEMEGRLIGDLLPGTKAPGNFIDRTRRIVENGNAEEFLIEYDADGIVACFRNLIAPFGGYVAVTLRDDTELMRDAKALGVAKAEAERANLAKSKFLAAASHDLRQPVQSLIMLMAVIKRQVADRPKVAQAAQMATESIKSLNEMLTGFLDISRLDAGVVQPVIASVDVSAMASRLAREYQPRAAAEGLALRFRPRDFHARTDAALLERILRNLLENALRYTARGGVLIGLRQRGDRVRLDVIDTGIGIPLDKQAEIFEEFRQLGNPARDSSLGQGLGLAIVARLAKLLKAEVQVNSRPGRGARFSLLLPQVHAAPVAVLSRPAVDHPGGRILVIEDNAAVRQAYEAMLGFSGYEIVSAETGEEALELAAREGWRFDAILADHRLGAGLNGTAAAKEISLRAGRAIPTMVVTGDTAREPLTEISASGFAMLHKPVDADKLCATLASLLSGP
jgi:PAS domain S-box-containing protein